MELITENLPGWAPGTHHYRTPDGKNLAIEAMPHPEDSVIIEAGQEPMVDNILLTLGTSYAALKVVLRPTVVFLCDADGNAIDSDLTDDDPLTPLHTFPPGTSHEEVLRELGYAS